MVMRRAGTELRQQRCEGRFLALSYKHGYHSITLVKAGAKPKGMMVHQLVARAFIPNPKGYPLVRHLDGDRTNNRVENLAWGDDKMNANDAKGHGRWYARTNPNRAKLAESFIEPIRILIMQGVKYETIGLAFGIDETTVSEIATGRKRFAGLPRIKSLDPTATRRKKLTKEDEDVIIALLKQGERGSELAKHYGISQARISQIKINRLTHPEQAAQ
jgi:hypothetical protein